MTGWWQAVRGDCGCALGYAGDARSRGSTQSPGTARTTRASASKRGTYTLVVEINREHGRHVGEKIKVACQDKKVSTVMKGTAESDESSIEYGPVKK